LKFCGLTALEKRRSIGELIEAYKIITGKESIQWERFFELAPSKITLGHRYKLFKLRIGKKHYDRVLLVQELQTNRMYDATADARLAPKVLALGFINQGDY